MLSISLFIALLIDRLMPGLRTTSTETLFPRYFRWVEQNLFSRHLPPRLIPLLMLMPALLLVMLGMVFFKITMLILVFYTVIAFVCLEPAAINEEVDDWLNNLQDRESQNSASPDELFSRANRSLYTVVFWLVIGGPLMAVSYRCLEKLSFQTSLYAHDKWKPDIARLLSWLEWLPALISSYVFLVAGNFEAGLKQLRQMPVFNANPEALNALRLQQVGKAVLQTGDRADDYSSSDFLRRCRGLLLRSLVLWLLFAALLDYWF